MENRDKRDLPEVVAEILIEQHAMREDINAMRKDINGLREDFTGLREEFAGLRGEFMGLREIVETNEAAQQRRHEEMVALFNGQTNAILDAMNRGNDRYHQTNERVDKVETRVTKLEKPAADAA